MTDPSQTYPPTMGVIACGQVVPIEPAHPAKWRIDRICQDTETGAVTAICGASVHDHAAPPPLPAGSLHVGLVAVRRSAIAIFSGNIATSVDWPTDD